MSNTGWNCLVESDRGGKYHAAAVDSDGTLRGVACSIQIRNDWQVVRPDKLSTYGVCTRCADTGAVDEIPGVARERQERQLLGTTIPEATFAFDPDRYSPPIDVIGEVTTTESSS